MSSLQFDLPPLPPGARALRDEVRTFLDAERAAGRLPVGTAPGDLQALRRDPGFSRRCAAAGYIGMTWPRRYGGHERSYLERHVVTEELLAAGAPVWAHWVADRQSGPMLLRYAGEPLKAALLPRITRGECYFCIGMSEPDSGSDLFSARCRAEPVDGGYRINGRKIWTSNAQGSHYMIALLRTAPATPEDRRHGLSQFLVDMGSPGIEVQPIRDMAGGADFNEVRFQDVFVPGDHLLGERDLAWKQATGELALERSGPERFLETLFVLNAFVAAIGDRPDDRTAEGLGRLVAELGTLRQLSLSVASMLEAGRTPDVEAAVVKEMGTNWEQALPGAVRDLAPTSIPDPGLRLDFEHAMAHATLIAPKLTIQGGTREILRGIVARGLGLR